jgi:hypothetical protein
MDENISAYLQKYEISIWYGTVGFLIKGSKPLAMAMFCTKSKILMIILPLKSSVDSLMFVLAVLLP